MHHLGVPTTRALSLCLTGDHVVRDMLYDGHPAAEPGAVVCRVAPTFTRFGHFEILAARNEIDLLRQFTDYTIRHSFPELVAGESELGQAVYLNWFRSVCDRTLDMIVDWMRVGFVHGVMNTDNMSILGLTIDYGPYGWLDDYDPDWTPNTTDAAHRRYRFAAQPAIAQWNLLQLANAIYPLIEAAEPLKETLIAFEQNYQAKWRQMMAAKLGLNEQQTAADETLFLDLDAVLRLEEVDMTIFYRLLADIHGPKQDPAAVYAGLEPAFYDFAGVSVDARQTWEKWLAAYIDRLQADENDPNERRMAMNRVNPKYVLRNYMAQLAIDQAEGGDFSLIHEFHELLRTPYAEQPQAQTWAARRPDWARTRVGCSQLCCSS